MAYVRYYSKICQNYSECRSKGRRREAYAKGLCNNCYKVAYARSRGVPPAVRHEDPARAHRSRHFERRYGITLEERDALLAGPCGVEGCSRDPKVIDHEHGTKGSYRAALCVKHNTMIHSDLTAEDYEAVARYLREHA